MRVTNWTSLVFLVPASAWISISCSESGCQKTLSCGTVVDASDVKGEDAGSDASSPPVDAGPDGASSGPPFSPVCSPTPTQGCVPAEASTIFVDPSADVNGDGSKQAPLRTIREGIGLAREKATARVILCNGVYDEPVNLSERDVIEALQGGFNCDSWIYNPSGETLVRPGVGGFALRIVGFTGSLVISDITFEAAAAKEPGESSIAAFVAGTNSVQLRRVQLVAHDGMPGEEGALEPFVAGKLWPTATSLNGNWGKGGTNDPNIHVGADATEVTCPNGENTRGGRGGGDPELTNGESGLPNATGGQADPANPFCASEGCLESSPSCQCVATTTVHGSDAAAEPAGAGARTSGTLDTTGWLPAAGVDGAIGRPGGGGAGGNGSWAACDAYRISWYGGGGGGAGGCGGNGGTAGRGGGASIALLVLDSQVAVARSTLIAGNAGDGGAGAAGQEGQLGGSGGGVDTMGSAGQTAPCSGGNGGKGGSGGSGGGGAGGIATAIGWAGNEPTIDVGTTLTFGSAGALGLGGIPGANDGIAGIAESMIQIKSD